MFQWAFAGTTSTIVIWCIIERKNLWTYIFYSVYLVSWVYALIVHWVWNPEGWIKVGLINFGCGVVHTLCGTAGLIATIMLGPRKDRFDINKEN